ncbi:hypothetical protein L202_00329 [Cryptococcus amylolentus CBS 6039]|uniref:Uncharacterized protein n=1 Tax=Cryptococcus amylolentus CBS 6039 TaxID=1295533 RepID=A0A1E3I709_9TREE|nr:hypothetical protein L202_00329 [Cryptococcus amylolentus CBS 6039]ODN84362.1 hypothetical protein L202_00329 [Cryptococcus amylolentus CBS 6039]
MSQEVDYVALVAAQRAQLAAKEKYLESLKKMAEVDREISRFTNRAPPSLRPRRRPFPVSGAMKAPKAPTKGARMAPGKNAVRQESFPDTLLLLEEYIYHRHPISPIIPPSTTQPDTVSAINSLEEFTHLVSPSLPSCTLGAHSSHKINGSDVVVIDFWAP